MNIHTNKLMLNGVTLPPKGKENSLNREVNIEEVVLLNRLYPIINSFFIETDRNKILANNKLNQFNLK